MLPFVVFVVSSLFLIGGFLCLYEYTLYTDEQKSCAPRLAPTYFRSLLMLMLVGTVGFVAADTSVASDPTILGVMGIFAVLPAILQYQMHRQMNLDTAPLVASLTSKVEALYTTLKSLLTP